MKKVLLAAILNIFTYHAVQAQSYIGYTPDNYSGVHGVFYNPSSVVNSKLRADINLFSVSGLAGSDYLNLDFNRLIKGETDFEFGSGINENPSNENNFFLNFDVIGPSFMFDLSPIHSIGFTTRARGLLNVNNINGDLYKAFEEAFENMDEFQTDMENLNGTFHAWAEFGLTYGRVLFDDNTHSLTGGISLKYLRGAGGYFLHSPNSSFNYNLTDDLLTSTGTMNYGRTPGFDQDDINLSNPGTGFGVDLGFTYEYRPGMGDADLPYSGDYQFKLGISAVDFGSISYDEVRLNSYDLNTSVNVNNFQGEDLETDLRNNYMGTEEVITTKLSLPTAMHVLLDYKIRDRLYVAVQGSLSLTSNSRSQYNRIINSITAVPRIETKWLGFGLPIGIRQYDDVVIGTTLRLGPLHLGSGSVLSNLIFNTSTTTDVYAAVKVPLFARNGNF